MVPRTHVSENTENEVMEKSSESDIQKVAQTSWLSCFCVVNFDLELGQSKNEK